MKKWLAVLLGVLLLTTGTFAGSWVCPEDPEYMEWNIAEEVKRQVCTKTYEAFGTTYFDTRMTITTTGGSWHITTWDDYANEASNDESLNWDWDDYTGFYNVNTINCQPPESPGGCVESMAECMFANAENSEYYESYSNEGANTTVSEFAGCLWLLFWGHIPHHAECDDGINNDGEQDDDIDFPADAQCMGAFDNDETNRGTYETECADWINNDGTQDSNIDYPADNQCVSGGDNSEAAPGYQM